MKKPDSAALRKRYSVWDRRAWSIQHPDLESLVAFRDGELARARVPGLWQHLNRCDECRLEFHRLQYVTESPREVPEGGLPARMQAAMEQWENSAEERGRTGEQVRRRVATEIGPFLGAQATDAILQTVSDRADNLLTNLEPVLGLFLGARAASRLVGHVVDAALVRA